MRPTRYKAASYGVSTLAGRGCQGAETSVIRPVKGNMTCPDDVNYNLIQTALRAPVERAGTMFKQFKALCHVSLDPSVITDLVSSTVHRGTWRGNLTVAPGRFRVAR